MDFSEFYLNHSESEIKKKEWSYEDKREKEQKDVEIKSLL